MKDVLSVIAYGYNNGYEKLDETVRDLMFKAAHGNETEHQEFYALLKELANLGWAEKRMDTFSHRYIVHISDMTLDAALYAYNEKHQTNYEFARRGENV